DATATGVVAAPADVPTAAIVGTGLVGAGRGGLRRGLLRWGLLRRRIERGLRDLRAEQLVVDLLDLLLGALALLLELAELGVEFGFERGVQPGLGLFDEAVADRVARLFHPWLQPGRDLERHAQDQADPVLFESGPSTGEGVVDPDVGEVAELQVTARLADLVLGFLRGFPRALHLLAQFQHETGVLPDDLLDAVHRRGDRTEIGRAPWRDVVYLGECGVSLLNVHTT